jgi:hypothetical protein
MMTCVLCLSYGVGCMLYVFRSIINQDTAIPDTECQLTLDSIDLYDDSNLPLL